MFNLHNHQTGSYYICLHGDGEEKLAWFKKFEEKMEDPPCFKTNPKTRSKIVKERCPSGRPFGSADEIWDEFAIPHVLIEYNINCKTDTEYYLSVPDALKNGEKLIKTYIFPSRERAIEEVIP